MSVCYTITSVRGESRGIKPGIEARALCTSHAPRTRPRGWNTGITGPGSSTSDGGALLFCLLRPM